VGLIGGIARTAVIAGTATAVSNNVSRRQANRWAQQEQAAQPAPTYAQPQSQPPPPQYQPPPPPQAGAAATDDVYEQIRKLGELKQAGILTDEEFASKKAQLLGI
jgi:hypothetical protein